jgi:predicted site-specific integrase-resolvase
MRRGMLMGRMGKRYDVPATEAAALLGVTPNTLRYWARIGKVPAQLNLSGRWLFNADDLALLGNVAKVVVVPDDD